MPCASMARTNSAAIQAVGPLSPVTLNAGAGLLVAGAVETLDDGVQRAALTIDAGLAAELLEHLRAQREAADAEKAAAPEGAPA